MIILAFIIGAAIGYIAGYISKNDDYNNEISKRYDSLINTMDKDNIRFRENEHLKKQVSRLTIELNKYIKDPHEIWKITSGHYEGMDNYKSILKLWDSDVIVCEEE